jgi:hypothetical protein
MPQSYEKGKDTNSLGYGVLLSYRTLSPSCASSIAIIAPETWLSA